MSLHSRIRIALRHSPSLEPADRSERGDTLVEVLMTLIVLSICALALIIAFSTSLSASITHRSLAANDVVLRSAAETALSLIQQQSNPAYVSCASPSDYNKLIFGTPSNYTVSIAVTYWNATNSSFDPGVTQTECNSSSVNEPELITLTVKNISNNTQVWTNFVVDARGQLSASAFRVTAVSPSSLGQGVSNQTLSVTGTGFVNGATVTFSGSGITVNSSTYVSATAINVNVSVSDSAPSGTRTITVTNPDGSNATSGPIFTVTGALNVNSVSPSSLGQGVSNQTLSVTGTGFVNGATVTFSGSGITVNSSTYVSATAINVNVSVSDSAPSGTRTITVTNPDGSNATSGPIFTVTGTSTVLHVHNMVGSVEGGSVKQSWGALVTVYVQDSNGNPVSGVTVTGSWDTRNDSYDLSCTTDSSGSCQFYDGVSLQLGANDKSRTFTVSGLSLSGYTYSIGANWATPASATANQPG